MLYELIAVVRSGEIKQVKEIARTAGLQILQSKGVIRGITNWGPFLLPKPTKKHQNLNHTGHYLIMRFDSSAAVQDQIQYALSRNPHMIRSSIVKIGDKLHGQKNTKGIMQSIEGKVDWGVSNLDVEMGAFTHRQTSANSTSRLPELY